MNNLVDMNYLYKHLDDKDIVIVDCRYNLAEPTQGRKAYQADHIQGAYYLDLAEDLSSEVSSYGGRHPLPKIEALIETLEKIGINNMTHVIAYDDQNGPFASRLWWLLKYLGHDKVSVLNENYSQWKKANFPITSNRPKVTKTTFKPNIQSDMLMEIDEVKQINGNQAYKLIDSRAPERYSGEVEPIDLKAGHIPGAANYFWEDNVARDGGIKSKEELTEHFKTLKTDKNLVVYCGSGVTGSVNILTLDNLGIKAQLYPGGWSEWSSFEDNPVEKDI